MDTLNDVITDLLIEQEDLIKKGVGPDSFWYLSDTQEKSLVVSLEGENHASKN